MADKWSSVPRPTWETKGKQIDIIRLEFGISDKGWWRRTTADDVAQLLAKAELAPLQEAPRKNRLGRRGEELAPEIKRTAAVIKAHFGSILETMAEIIDEEGVLHRARKVLEPPRGSSQKDRVRIRKAIATLKRLLPGHIEATRAQYPDLALRQQQALAALERCILRPPLRRPVSWHGCAQRFAALIDLLLRPHRNPTWSRDSPPVCFVQLALAHIGAGTVSRSAIARVISRP
jgi:hypothetical protein